jgi:hypothetical protein
VLGEQGGVGQLANQLTRLVRCGAQQAGACPGGDIGRRLQRQQPEKPAGLRAEVMVRPREDAPSVGGHARSECVEAALRAPQIAGDRGQREAGMGGSSRGNDSQGQRQPPAQLDDFLHRLRLRRDPRSAQPSLKGLSGPRHTFPAA